MSLTQARPAPTDHPHPAPDPRSEARKRSAAPGDEQRAKEIQPGRGAVASPRGEPGRLIDLERRARFGRFGFGAA